VCRIAGKLPAASAFGALQLICSAAKWGEPDVRLAEALIAKCRDENGLASVIVGGLERHVGGLGKSLRFGKLLLTVVKDVANVKENYGGVIRNVAGQSSVFLAKRAILLLPVDAMDVSEP